MVATPGGGSRWRRIRSQRQPTAGTENRRQRQHLAMSNSDRQWQHHETAVATSGRHLIERAAAGEHTGEEERATMKIDWKSIQDKGDRRLATLVHRETPPYILALYHVMNNTCIYLRFKGPNIYMYRRGRIYREPLKIQ
jgi:DNA-binding transcriptional regulator YdaS (Cro superfamily)